MECEVPWGPVEHEVPWVPWSDAMWVPVERDVPCGPVEREVPWGPVRRGVPWWGPTEAISLYLSWHVERFFLEMKGHKQRFGLIM